MRVSASCPTSCTFLAWLMTQCAKLSSLVEKHGNPNVPCWVWSNKHVRLTCVQQTTMPSALVSHMRHLGYFNVFMTLSFQKRSTRIDYETPWVQSVDSLNHGRHVWSQNPCLHTAPGASGTLQDKNCRVNLKKIGFYWRKPWFFKKPYVLEIHLCFYKMIEGLVPEIHELLCWRTHIFFQELGFAGFCFKITWLFKPQPVSMII